MNRILISLKKMKIIKRKGNYGKKRIIDWNKKCWSVISFWRKSMVISYRKWSDFGRNWKSFIRVGWMKKNWIWNKNSSKENMVINRNWRRDYVIWSMRKRGFERSSGKLSKKIKKWSTRFIKLRTKVIRLNVKFINSGRRIRD